MGNTVASSAYTYEVDVCFLAALATKLAFPWIYQYFTGESLFPQLRELGIPLVDSVKSADVRGEAQVSDYQEYFEYNVEAKSAPSIQERASNWFAELGKAVTKEPNRKLRKLVKGISSGTARECPLSSSLLQNFQQSKTIF